MKKKSVICSVVLLLICAVLCFVPIRWNVEKVLQVQLVENLSTGEVQETKELLKEIAQE